MKSAEALENALQLKEKELKDLEARLADLQVWLDSSAFMGNEGMFISCVSERQEKQKRQNELQTQIRFLKWVLN
jgi:hypothetical protein